MHGMLMLVGQWGKNTDKEGTTLEGHKRWEVFILCPAISCAVMTQENASSMVRLWCLVQYKQKVSWQLLTDFLWGQKNKSSNIEPGISYNEFPIFPFLNYLWIWCNFCKVSGINLLYLRTVSMSVLNYQQKVDLG